MARRRKYYKHINCVPDKIWGSSCGVEITHNTYAHTISIQGWYDHCAGLYLDDKLIPVKEFCANLGITKEDLD